ncbi:MAG: RnfABCDGE type electron transport complex subunit D [Candidatus Omnitrophota bacterium]
MSKLASIKTQLIFFLSGFGIYLSIIDKDVKFLLSCSAAVISAIIIESSLNYLKEKKFSITESCIISGLIVGFVLASDNIWWIFVAATVLAIGSKYLIRLKNKHIFNPAAFGIFLSIIFFGASTQWKGTYAWYILVPFGIYFIAKIRKMELLISYFAVSLGLFAIQSFIQKVPLINIFGYLSYFYIFIMLIEPKTTPIKPLAKIIFGTGVAGLIFILSNVGVRFDVEIFALLVFNLSVPILEKLSIKK